MKTKLFISYHKDGMILQNEVLTPIHVGAKKSNVELNMLRDCDGDNISEKNAYLCEITAQYWAWKNVEADYYGFMHYRRHFVFNDIDEEADDGGLVYFDRISDEYIKKIGLDEEAITECIGDNDLVLPLLCDVSGREAPSMEIQYACQMTHHAKDFDKVLQITENLYPEYHDTIRKFRNGCVAYWCNMFIMKKTLFFNYCEWLFSILNVAEKEVDISAYDTQEKRALAYIAERLFSIYVMKLLTDNKDLKVKNLKVAFVLNPSIPEIEIEKPITENKILAPTKTPNFAEIVDSSLDKAYREIASCNRLPGTDTEALEECLLQFKKLNKRRTIVYGAGCFGIRTIQCMRKLEMKLPTFVWDVRAKTISEVEGVQVCYPDFDQHEFGDCNYVIAIANKKVSKEIKQRLIHYGAGNVYEKDDFMRILINKLWDKKVEEQRIDR